MIEPKVSVIIATYNRAGLLPRAVNSVLNQTLKEYEIIIVDDASSDDTQQIIAGFEDPRIRSARHEVNCGQSVATNAGIERARGEYVTLLDDDDEWPADRLRYDGRCSGRCVSERGIGVRVACLRGRLYGGDCRSAPATLTRETACLRGSTGTRFSYRKRRIYDTDIGCERSWRLR